MLPENLAIVDDDNEFREFLSEHLRQLGVQVVAAADGSQLLGRSDAFDFKFYVVDLKLPDVDGTGLIKILRQRSSVGLVVISGRVEPETFAQVVQAGADMYLAKPVHFEQVTAAIEAVFRRAGTPGERPEWKLDRHQAQLIAPDSVRIDLTPGELTIFECFVSANGSVVSREALRRELGRDAEAQGSTDAVTAMVFRLRRRIERATPALLPLQSKSRVGYEFRAPLKAF